MKKILGALALVALVPAAAFAQGFNTTGGYGSSVLDTKGAGYVNTDGLKATYTYQINDITPVATATDIVTLTGSATKTIRIQQVCIGGDATTAAVYDIYLYKRTVADTGGTGTTADLVAQNDSLDATPSGTVTRYTANPTITAGGVLVRGGHVVLVDADTPAWGPNAPTCWTFGDGATEALTLRGVAQQLAINHGGSAVPTGASMYYTIVWKEEP